MCKVWQMWPAREKFAKETEGKIWCARECWSGFCRWKHSAWQQTLFIRWVNKSVKCKHECTHFSTCKPGSVSHDRIYQGCICYIHLCGWSGANYFVCFLLELSQVSDSSHKAKWTRTHAISWSSESTCHWLCCCDQSVAHMQIIFVVQWVKTWHYFVGCMLVHSPSPEISIVPSFSCLLCMQTTSTQPSC